VRNQTPGRLTNRPASTNLIEEVDTEKFSLILDLMAKNVNVKRIVESP